MIDERPSPEFEQFCEDVRLGIEQLARGEYHEYDDAGLRKLFEELKQRAMERRNRSGLQGG